MWLENTEKVVWMMRGTPGSGKSHTVSRLIKELGVKDNNVISADHYFTPMTREFRQQGIDISPKEERDEYLSNFNQGHLPLAHDMCLDRFKKAVDAGETPLIVDNTNVIVSHIRPYALYASAAGYDVKFQEPDSPWWKEYSGYLRNKRLHAAKIRELVDILHQKNTHDVPKETIAYMLDQWEPDLDIDKVLSR